MGSIRSIENDGNLLVAATELADDAAPESIVEQEILPAESCSSSIPLWLWWNILSLDAPAVAAVWTLLFARASRTKIPVATVAVVALAVWVIYLADRLLDGWLTIDKRILKERHRFCYRHRFAVFAFGVLGAFAGAWLTYHSLDGAEARTGLLLSAVLALYMMCVHVGGPAVSRLFPKEAIVGVLFAAGTALPVWCHPRAFSWDALYSWLLFALVCVLNCLAIQCWEDEIAVRGRVGAQSRFAGWSTSRIPTFATGTALLGIAGHWLLRSDSNAIAAAGTAALLILLLNSLRTRLSGHALRVLADAALLIPAAFALLVR
ncbi:MAG: hypothetical protein ACRD40_00115 [Candidatus Acidiferrales bacterium]